MCPAFIKDAQRPGIGAEQGLELLGHVAHVRQALVLAVAVQRVASVILHTNVSIIQNARDGPGAWCAQTKCKIVSEVFEAASFSRSSTERANGRVEAPLEQGVVARQVVPGALFAPVDGAGGARRRLGQLLEDRRGRLPISLAGRAALARGRAAVLRR